MGRLGSRLSWSKAHEGTGDHSKEPGTAHRRCTDPHVSMVMLLFGLDDHRVGLIRTGQVIAIDQAIDFLPLGFPRRQQRACQDVTDVVVQRICRLSKMFIHSGYRAAKSRAVLGRQRHEGPVHRRLIEVASIICQRSGRTACVLPAKSVAACSGSYTAICK